MKYALLFGVLLIQDQCAPNAEELLKQRQQTVDLCETRGGIPIINDQGTNILRCDFPGVVVPPRVEK
jgi:hypothetical protein